MGDVNPVNVLIIIEKLKPFRKRHGFQTFVPMCSAIIILATTILGANHPTGSNSFAYPTGSIEVFCQLLSYRIQFAERLKGS